MFNLTSVLYPSTPLLLIHHPQKIKLKINNGIYHSQIVRLSYCHSISAHQNFSFLQWRLEVGRDRVQTQDLIQPRLAIWSHAADSDCELLILLPPFSKYQADKCVAPCLVYLMLRIQTQGFVSLRQHLYQVDHLFRQTQWEYILNRCYWNVGLQMTNRPPTEKLSFLLDRTWIYGTIQSPFKNNLPILTFQKNIQ